MSVSLRWEMSEEEAIALVRKLLPQDNLQQIPIKPATKEAN
jgi:hypothetical protein